MMKEILLVFFGSGLGGAIRYIISIVVKDANNFFPYQTLMANILACFILGFLVSKYDGNESIKYLLAIGFCGGLSTYSTYALENLNMIALENIAIMLLYSMITLVLCLVVVYVGMYLGK